MATIDRFEDINAWKLARQLSKVVYEQIVNNQEIHDYPLKDQINRSSGSTMDNIAEGFGRQGNKEFRQFLNIAHGSNSEVKSQLYRAFDRNYITEDKFKELKGWCEDISKMINGLVKYLNKTDYSGTKFKVDEPEGAYVTGQL